MRSALCIFLLLLVLLSGTAICLAADIYQDRDQVEYRAETRYGDSLYAEGLEADIRSSYQDFVFWDTHYVLGGEAETEFSFYPTGKPREDYQHEFFGVELQNDYFSYGWHYNEIAGDEPVTGIALAYRELYHKTQPGTENNMDIYLKDYLDYYPLIISTDFPSITSNSSVFFPGDDEDGYSDSVKIRDFFRIPVLPDEKVNITLSRDISGAIASTGSGTPVGEEDMEPKIYQLYTYGVLTDNACYFTISTHSSGGDVVDTSLIPGGYGIYCLPYVMEERGHTSTGTFEVGRPLADELEMVYSLSPEIEIIDLRLNDNQDKLLLHSIEQGEYVFTVIDIATMSTKQRLVLFPDFTDHFLISIYDQEDIVVVTMGGGREIYQEELALLSLDSSGRYNLEFTCPISRENLEWDSWSWKSLDYDGERLAVIGPWAEDTYYVSSSPSFYTAVYDKNGLLYLGSYISSLDTPGSDLGYYYYSDEALPFDIAWPE